MCVILMMEWWQHNPLACRGRCESATSAVTSRWRRWVQCPLWLVGSMLETWHLRQWERRLKLFPHFSSNYFQTGRNTESWQSWTLVKNFKTRGQRSCAALSERPHWQEECKDSLEQELSEQSQDSSQRFCTKVLREIRLAGTQRQFRPGVGWTVSRE